MAPATPAGSGAPPGHLASDWADYCKFLLSRDEHRLADAARVTGVAAALIERAAELLARPRADGTAPKSSFMLRRQLLVQQRYTEQRVLAAMSLICGAGNRPGASLARAAGTSVAWCRPLATPTGCHPKSTPADARSRSTWTTG
ncbi:MAG: hypothetical protein IPO43_17450 [Rhodoferax sp.]|nr:hypothetical protein [Rhodoferax sp.]